MKACNREEILSLYGFAIGWIDDTCACYGYDEAEYTYQCEQEHENENDSYRISDAFYKLEKYDCYFDNQDNCFVNGFASSKTVRQGLKRLEENILKDNDNVYVVLRISKKEFGYYDK